MLFLNLNRTVCHFLELMKVKFIRELSVVNHKIGVKVGRPIGVVQLLTEQVIVCCTHFLVGLLVMIVFSSSNTLHLISSWMEIHAEE